MSWSKEEARVYQKKRRAEKRSRGECREGGCEVKTEDSRCEFHRLRHNERNRKHKTLCKSHPRPKMTQHFLRLSRGVCVHCAKKPPRPNRVKCEECAFGEKLRKATA